MQDISKFQSAGEFGANPPYQWQNLPDSQKVEKKLTGLQQASPKHHHNKETFPEKIPFNKMHLIRFPIWEEAIHYWLSECNLVVDGAPWVEATIGFNSNATPAHQDGGLRYFRLSKLSQIVKANKDSNPILET